MVSNLRLYVRNANVLHINVHAWWAEMSVDKSNMTHEFNRRNRYKTSSHIKSNWITMEKGILSSWFWSSDPLILYRGWLFQWHYFYDTELCKYLCMSHRLDCTILTWFLFLTRLISAYRIFLSVQITGNKRSAQWDGIYDRVTSCFATHYGTPILSIDWKKLVRSYDRVLKWQPSGLVWCSKWRKRISKKSINQNRWRFCQCVTRSVVHSTPIKWIACQSSAAINIIKQPI